MRVYSQKQAVEDIVGLMQHLQLTQAHLVGLSMGGYAVLHFGLTYPTMARSLVIGGCGYGSVAGERENFQRDVEHGATNCQWRYAGHGGRLLQGANVRVQFADKDPRGWEEFAAQLAEHSTIGSALTFRGVLAQRPSVYTLEAQMQQLQVPTLIITGDGDEPCQNQPCS